eukprot:1821655-Pyramimonas_sp.AAC.1
MLCAEWYNDSVDSRTRVVHEASPRSVRLTTCGAPRRQQRGRGGRRRRAHAGGRGARAILGDVRTSGAHHAFWIEVGIAFVKLKDFDFT